MRSKAFVVVFLLGITVGFSQKRPERPKIHTDFYFGSNPASREFSSFIAKDNVVTLLVGLHNGWDLPKIAKESKVPEETLAPLLADLEEQRLAFEVDQFESRPALPVIRDKDMEKVKDDLRSHTNEFAAIILSNWSEIETAVTGFAGGKTVPKEELMYQIVVGGILFGSMNDTFFEDQTLMPPPPRRMTSQRYYGWLVESEPQLAGTLKRDQWESDGYVMVSIGQGFQKERPTLTQVRDRKGMVLDEAEARRLRTVIGILSRDKLLPFFKKNRSEFINAVTKFDAGKYARVADVFSWYYDQIANGVAGELARSGRIKPPAGHYTYAVKVITR
jgi:hypothetical protein